ncbi:hypothetical protein COK06_13145 [Bacillus cereus]|nr:hypothetical protein COK06_13145 [Bacillus cereus]
MDLNRTENGFGRDYRLKENENWETIERGHNDLEKKNVQATGAANSAFYNANKALEKAEAAEDLSKNVQEQLNTIVVAGDSSVEAAQARVELNGKTHESLKEHTDAIHSYMNVLSQKSFEQYSRKSTPITMATFIDDDGKKEVWTKLKPIFEAEGVPLTLAIIDSWINKSDCLSLEQILHLQNNLGWEMTSHTINHLHLAQLSYGEAKVEIFDSKKKLIEKGLNIESIVYPFGDDSEMVHDICRNAQYDCGVDTQEGVNTLPISTYRLQRIALGSYFAPTSTEYPITTTFNDYYKKRIDEAIQKGGWIIFKLHCASADHTEEQQLYIKQCIQYLKQNGINIVNLRDGLEVFRNNFDHGTKKNGGNYTIVDPTGRLWADQVGTHIAGEFTADVPFDTTTFPNRKVSFNYILSKNAANFPEARGGVLLTYHFPDTSFVFQLYHPAGSSKFYKRTWDSKNTVWSQFELASGVEVMKRINGSTILGNHGITDAALDANKVTYAPIPTSNAAGFPKDAAGLLKVDRMYAFAGYQHEFYHQHNSNRMFYRNTRTSGEFLEWEELPRKTDTYTKTCSFGNIPVQWHLEFDTGIAASPGDFVLLSPANGKMHDGINFTAYISDMNRVIVRAINYTNTERVMPNKDFRITIVKAF